MAPQPQTTVCNNYKQLGHHCYSNQLFILGRCLTELYPLHDRLLTMLVCSKHPPEPIHHLHADNVNFYLYICLNLSTLHADNVGKETVPVANCQVREVLYHTCAHMHVGIYIHGMNQKLHQKHAHMHTRCHTLIACSYLPLALHTHTSTLVHPVLRNNVQACVKCTYIRRHTYVCAYMYVHIWSITHQCRMAYAYRVHYSRTYVRCLIYIWLYVLHAQRTHTHNMQTGTHERRQTRGAAPYSFTHSLTHSLTHTMSYLHTYIVVT